MKAENCMYLKQYSIQWFWSLALFFLLATVSILLVDVSVWVIYAACAIPFLLLMVQHPRWLFYLLIFFIPPSIEFSVTDSLATDLPDEPLIMLCCFLALTGVLWQHTTRKLELSSVGVLLLFQLFWLVFSVVNSTNEILSIKFLIAKLWYLGAFILLPILILKEKTHIRTTALLYATSVLLCTIWVMVRHAGAGFTFSTINDSVQPFFRNHVNYSVLLVGTISIIYAVFVLAKNKQRKIICGIVLLIMLVALYFSYARGAWLALFAGIISFWLLRNRLLLSGYLLAILITIGAVVYLAQDDRYEQYAPDYKTTIFHTDFSEHWQATYQMKDLSTAERFHRWVAGLRMVKDNWQTGWGPNTFYPQYKEYTTPAFKTWVSDNPERSTVHNYFLLTLIEQGIPGLLLLLLLLGFAFYTVQKIYHRTKDPFWQLAVSVSAIILSQLCTVNFLSDLVETDEGGSLFYLCLAVIIICDIKTRTASKLSSHV